MNSRPQPSSDGGFTLVELLVAKAILEILEEPNRRAARCGG
jgi:Tfp pilus assembly protein FimT